MFQSFSSLFARTPRELSGGDIRHFIEGWLREQIGSDGIVCQAASGSGIVEVRVSSPTLQQEVLLLEYDLTRKAKTEIDYAINRLQVFVG